MKIHPLLLAPAFSLALFLAPARAQEPFPVNLTPEMKALVADLLKETGQAAPEAAPVPEPAPAAPVAAIREAKPPLGFASSLRTSSLAPGSLNGGRLAPSAALGGRGTAGGTARMSTNDWRQLFPAREDRR